MLNGEEAKTLAEVSAGTLIGELLRRYWMPIASVSELDERPIVPVRLLGTDLVLYKDRSSTTACSVGGARTVISISHTV